MRYETWKIQSEDPKDLENSEKDTLGKTHEKLVELELKNLLAQRQEQAKKFQEREQANKKKLYKAEKDGELIYKKRTSNQ